MLSIHCCQDFSDLFQVKYFQANDCNWEYSKRVRFLAESINFLSRHFKFDFQSILFAYSYICPFHYTKLQWGKPIFVYSHLIDVSWTNASHNDNTLCIWRGRKSLDNCNSLSYLPQPLPLVFFVRFSAQILLSNYTWNVNECRLSNVAARVCANRMPEWNV